MPSLRPQDASLLFLNHLLSTYPGISPFTLVYDTVEQSAKPLIRRIVHNALHHKPSVHVFYTAYELIPKYVDTFRRDSSLQVIKGNRDTPDTVLQDIRTFAEELKHQKGARAPRLLIVIDSLNHLVSLGPALNLSYFLSSLLSTIPGTTLLAVHHVDIPLPEGRHAYSPSPFTLLSYLATTVVKVHPLSHILVRKHARDRSLEEPSFGLAEEQDGVLTSLTSACGTSGMILEVENRRKSGLVGCGDWFYLPSFSMGAGRSSHDQICLVRDHPLFSVGHPISTTPNIENIERSTFDLELTQKQRLDREGVVLPYFDAQQGKSGAGEGGRILYDMGMEDDFDEEEDEI